MMDRLCPPRGIYGRGANMRVAAVLGSSPFATICASTSSRRGLVSRAMKGLALLAAVLTCANMSTICRGPG